MFLLKISMKKQKQKKLQKGWMQLMMLRRPDDVWMLLPAVPWWQQPLCQAAGLLYAGWLGR